MVEWCAPSKPLLRLAHRWRRHIARIRQRDCRVCVPVRCATDRWLGRSFGSALPAHARLSGCIESRTGIQPAHGGRLEPPFPPAGQATDVKYLLVICGLLLVVAAGCGQSAGASQFGSLIVTVTAGPTCPAEQINDPTCAPRPVKGAGLRLEGSREVTLVTDANGTARHEQIPAGAYRLVPQQVSHPSFPTARQASESAWLSGSGGGTRTPDTRIMIRRRQS
jgi:hypothetical protein